MNVSNEPVVDVAVKGSVLTCLDDILADIPAIVFAELAFCNFLFKTRDRLPHASKGHSTDQTARHGECGEGGYRAMVRNLAKAVQLDSPRKHERRVGPMSFEVRVGACWKTIRNFRESDRRAVEWVDDHRHLAVPRLSGIRVIFILEQTRAASLPAPR